MRLNKYSQFGNQIRELRQALLLAKTAREEYYRSINPLFALGIFYYKDHMAGRFLTDVLLSRITTASGDLIQERQAIIEERDSMYRELGFQEGYNLTSGDRVTVEKAAGAVLQGRLRVLSTE